VLGRLLEELGRVLERVVVALFLVVLLGLIEEGLFLARGRQLVLEAVLLGVGRGDRCRRGFSERWLARLRGWLAHRGDGVDDRLGDGLGRGGFRRRVGDDLLGLRLGRGVLRLRRAREVPPRGTERLGLLLRDLVLRRAVLALQVQVLSDCVVEDPQRRRRVALLGLPS
jgi:hypothetical protein